jgi:FAD synthetase
VLKKIQIKDEISITNENIDNIIKYAKDYLQDAKYYKNQSKFETSLTSIAYCEGLLDALKLLDVVNFDWATRELKEK